MALRARGRSRRRARAGRADRGLQDRPEGARERPQAGAAHAEVWIGRDRTKRLVRIHDDGAGFEADADDAGQGLKNMKTRAASIGGGFSFISAPGRGTALEVALRA
ncbi:MAG TPA: hypothetical protein VFL41_09440 [Gaiellaceae bacterium]|nr:hypothetical protein [Gaiellaceae bacterium]